MVPQVSFSSLISTWTIQRQTEGVLSFPKSSLSVLTGHRQLEFSCIFTRWVCVSQQQETNPRNSKIKSRTVPLAINLDAKLATLHCLRTRKVFGSWLGLTVAAVFSSQATGGTAGFFTRFPELSSQIFSS